MKRFPQFGMASRRITVVSFKYLLNNDVLALAKAISWVIAGVSLAVFNVVNASDVEISPFITSGPITESGNGGQVEPNLWFFINNSQSMTRTWYGDPYKMAYNPNVTYKIPYRLDGTKLPNPKKVSGKWTVYDEPFKDSLTKSNNNLGTDEDDIGSTCDKKTSDDAINCHIWENYYRNRLLSVKSILSIMLTEEKERFKGVRVGYDQHNANNKNERNNQITPVISLSEDANVAQFKEWFYGLDDFSDDEKVLTSIRQMVKRIQTDAKSESNKNPLIYDPSKPYDADANKLLACRSNHLIVLSDDEWAGEEFGGSKMEKINTPDGKGWLNMAPYVRDLNTSGSADYPGKVRNLADVAFSAWATDLDGDSTNNTGKNSVSPHYPEVDGEVKTLGGDKYNHPYNDPATWQHLNMHTIGFDIKPKHMVRINPPKGYTSDVAATPPNLGIEDKLLASNWVWKFDGNDSLSQAEIPRDLASAALASRGRFYNSTNPDNLREALLDILDLIGQSSTSTKDGVKASGGALANSQTGGNSFYATSYDADFAGDLVRKDLYDGDPDKKDSCFTPETLANFPAGASLYGKICDKANKWSATEKLAEKPYGERNIYTSKRESNAFVGQDFNFDNLTVEQKARIKGSDFPTAFGSLGVSGDDAKFKALVNYLKGDAANEAQNKLRLRGEGAERKVLGAITRSSPLVSGIPQISQVHPDKQSASFINFAKRYLYEKDTSTTPPTYTTLCDPACGTAVTDHNNVDIVYVGANDGMLHAFRASDGEEIFAYMPDAVYANLSKLSTSDAYKVAFVDGNIGVVVVGDKNKGWKKQLTASMGGGAKGIFSLDITDPTAANVKAEDVVMWEFTDKDSQYMGNIIGQPATVQLNDGTWAVVVGNGYNSAKGKAALVVINPETGQLIQELELSNNGDGTPNGLAPAYFQVFPNETGTKQNGIDRAYAGDLQGNLWVFDFTGATASGGVTVINNKPLFTAVNGAGIRQPITVAPLVRQHPTKYGNIVHFGTGALFNEKDLSSTIQNSIYAVWDDWVPKANGGLPTPRSESVKREHLNVVKFAQLNGEENNTVGGNQSTVGRTLSKVAGENKKIQWATKGSTFTDKKRGWYIDLPMGERAWQSPYYTFGANNSVAIGYDTANYSPVKVGTAPTPVAPVDVCSVSENAESGAISWKMTFNMSDATQPVAPVGTIDANGDGHVSSDDLVQKGTENVQLSGWQSNGVTFSDNSMRTFSPLLIRKPSTTTPLDLMPIGDDVCSFITQTQENNHGGLMSKQICRRSHTGAWKELR